MEIHLYPLSWTQRKLHKLHFESADVILTNGLQKKNNEWKKKIENRIEKPEVLKNNGAIIFKLNPFSMKNNGIK